jgi:hypothetical protein
MIDKSLGNMMVIAGMVGGSQAAISVLEDANNSVCVNGQQNIFLPKPMRFRQLDKEAVKLFRSWGVKWKDGESPDRGLTFPATVPEGWSVVRTDHYLYKHLLDERGQVRAQIMIHVQDHDSWISPRHKLHSSAHKDDWNDREFPYYPAVVDSNGKVLWRGAFVPEESREARDKRTGDIRFHIHSKGAALAQFGATKAQQKAFEKLKEHERWDYLEKHVGTLRDPYKMIQTEADKVLEAAYPDHRNASEYWDIGSENFKFPPNKSERPAGEYYSLHLTYEHADGSYADSGSSTLFAANDKKAIKRMHKRATNQGYNIKAQLTLGDRVVATERFMNIKPRRVPWYDSNTGEINFFGRGYDE